MRRIITAMLALAVLLGLAIAAPVTATADSGQGCAQDLGFQRPSSSDAASKTPVILVHGLGSSAGTWSKGKSPMISALSDGDVVVKTFDYESANERWVTEGDTAKRFAKTIVCYSKLYGGKKIIIVAHSMGGLLTRTALSWEAYGVPVASRVGHIITIGTPHKGAGLADAGVMLGGATCLDVGLWYGVPAGLACAALTKQWTAVPGLRLNSPELAALPRFPADITVKAIAGSVTWRSCAPWGCTDASRGGDLIVPISSATDEFTSTGDGDGKNVFNCSDPIALEIVSQPWCEHGNMLQAPEVQADVKASIQAYLASLKPKHLPLPPHTMYDFFSRFKLPFLNTWGTGMSEPGSVLNVVDNTTCNEPDYLCPHIYLSTASPGAGSFAKLCPGAESKQVATSWMIGGEPAEHYEHVVCPGTGTGEANVWYAPRHGLLVTVYDSPSGKVDLPGLRAVLDNIEWVS
jgi:pimeloyl-ACP methyl ester carboxylesterase